MMIPYILKKWANISRYELIKKNNIHYYLFWFSFQSNILTLLLCIFLNPLESLNLCSLLISSFCLAFFGYFKMFWWKYLFANNCCKFYLSASKLGKLVLRSGLDQKLWYSTLGRTYLSWYMNIPMSSGNKPVVKELNDPSNSGWDRFYLFWHSNSL